MDNSFLCGMAGSKGMPRYIRKKNGVTVWNCLGNKGCHCFVSSLNTDFHSGVGKMAKIMD